MLVLPNRLADDFLAAHLLARLCVAATYAMDPAGMTWSQRCRMCNGPHGRPMILEAEECAISLSHSDGYVLAAASPFAVGVDAEVLDRGFDHEEIAARVLSRHDLAAVRGAVDPRAAFLRQWVRLESLVKIGHISLDETRSVDLSALGVEKPTGSTVLRWKGYRVYDWTDGDVELVAISVGELVLVELDELLDLASERPSAASADPTTAPPHSG